MVDRVVRVQLVGDATSLIRAANEASSALRGIGNSSNSAGSQASSGANEAKSAWDKFKESVAGQVAIGDLISKGVEGAFGMLKDGFAHVIELGMGYEQSMNTLSAVTGANADQMAQLGEKAKQLGNDITIPGASASSAAEAMAELAKGGLNVSETMEAATGTLRLAAAAQIDAGKAAEIQANALNAFRLKADQADHVADLLANSANAASGEITDMAASLQQSATVAAGFGISVDDSATTLALFAKNGILGSDAGTSFKTMLTALASPTLAQTKALDDLGVRMYSASGDFVGMETLTNQLALAKKRLTVEEYNAAASTAFGTDAIRAANILGAEGTKGWNEMADAVGKSGGAQELAAAQSQGLTGAMDRLWNAADNVALTIYQQLSPALEGIADFGTTAFGWLGDAVGWMTELPAPVWAGVTAMGAMILLKGPLNALFIQAIAGYTRMALAVRGASFSLAGLATAAKGALAAIGGPFGLAVIGVTTALSFMGSATDDVTVSAADFGAAIDENTGKLKDNADAIIAKAAADAGSFDAIEKIGGTTQDYTAALLGNEDAQGRVHTLLLDQATAAVRNNDAWDRLVATGQTAGRSARDVASGILATGDAGNYASGELSDVLDASARFAADSDNLTTKQRQTAQAISVAGTAAGDAAGQTLTFDDALKQIQSSAAKAEDKATPFADALKSVKSAASEADSAAQFLSITLLQMSGNTVPAEQRARANAAAFRDVASAGRDLADAHRGVGDANDSVAEKQKKFDELAAHLGGTLDGQAESATNAAVTQRDLDAAGRDLAGAQDAVHDAEEAVNSATDKQKDALDKAAQSARDMTAETYNNNVGQLGMKGAIDQAVATMQGQREQFIKSAADAGISREAAEELANAQGLIPDNVRTTYETVGADDARKKADDLNAALDKINDRTVHYTVVGGEVTTVGTMKAPLGQLAEHAEGGMIRGPGTGTSDSIVARLSDGEFVVRASQTAKHRGLLEQINTPGFADGGLVSAKLVGDYKGKDWTDSLSGQIERLNQVIKASLGTFSGGLNPSQNPASFGWQRAAGIVPFSWNGNPFVGGVADRTQSLWTGLMNALVPQIPGGLMAPIWAYENRNNVNSPGNASFHSFGLAADINAPQNPNGAPGDGRSGPGVIPAGVARTLAARFGMEWGGDFRGTPDPMHFEIHVSPDQIGAGGTINLGGASGGAGVDRWRSLGLDVLTQVGNYKGMSLTPFIDRMLNQIRTESSGDPNAINNYDINAQRGDPSIGLLQVIGSTFRSALRGTPFEYLIAAGQRDPRASLTASTLYSLNRYGSLDRAWRGVAYDNGGILPPGFTMAYNGTGSNEAIFTGQQFNAMAAQAVPQAAPMQIEVRNFVDIDGMVSRTEVFVNNKLAEVGRVLTTSLAQTP